MKFQSFAEWKYKHSGKRTSKTIFITERVTSNIEGGRPWFTKSESTTASKDMGMKASAEKMVCRSDQSKAIRKPR